MRFIEFLAEQCEGSLLSVEQKDEFHRQLVHLIQQHLTVGTGADAASSELVATLLSCLSTSRAPAGTSGSSIEPRRNQSTQFQAVHWTVTNQFQR